MLSGAAGAYSGKIPFCAPMSRYRRGLLRQNPYLRPDVPAVAGLILTKSLSTPRRPDIAGAYSDKNSCYAPLLRSPRGLFWQNLLLRPAVTISPGLILTESLSAPRWSEIPGAYFNKISCYAPPFRYPRGLSWQNLFLRPTVPISPGLILTESLSAPRCTDFRGSNKQKLAISPHKKLPGAIPVCPGSFRIMKN